MISSPRDPNGFLSSIQNNLSDIPGLLELPCEEYADWYLSRVGTESYKEIIKMVQYIVLENCFGITQACGESPDFFVKQGVAKGAARRFVGHISRWLVFFRN